MDELRIQTSGAFVDYLVSALAAGALALAFFDFLHGIAEVRADRALQQLAVACGRKS